MTIGPGGVKTYSDGVQRPRVATRFTSPSAIKPQTMGPDVETGGLVQHAYHLPLR